MPNALARLMRLRAAQADTARRDLACALRAHDVSAAQLAASRAALRREARAVPGDQAHPLIGAYAAWLPTGQARIDRAVADQAVADHGLTTARVMLTEARLAMRACESVAESQSVSCRKDRLMREQLALEDSLRRPAPRMAMAGATG
jgi:hypothetical protein